MWDDDDDDDDDDDGETRGDGGSRAKGCGTKANWDAGAGRGGGRGARERGGEGGGELGIETERGDRAVEAESANGSLDLPLQSASARKRVGRTRLLRTPMAGGESRHQGYNLPSMATAARNLMELADYGDLSTKMSDMHHRRAGYPFGSTVDFATDAAGHPIFCLASLAIHTRNITADGRCSLTVKMSGWGGLANARVTIFGDVERLPKGEYQTAANEIFKAKYQGARKPSTWRIAGRLHVLPHEPHRGRVLCRWIRDSQLDHTRGLLFDVAGCNRHLANRAASSRRSPSLTRASPLASPTT